MNPVQEINTIVHSGEELIVGICRFAGLVLSLSVLTPPLWAEENKAPEIARQTLLERDTEINGTKVKAHVLRLVMPVGYKTPLHTHEGPGPRYVLKGRIKIEQSGQVREYGPGESFWETGQWMTAENIGDGEVELVIVEITGAK